LPVFRCGDRVETTKDADVSQPPTYLKGMRGVVADANHGTEPVWWQVTVRLNGLLTMVDIDHLRHVSLPEQIGELG